MKTLNAIFLQLLGFGWSTFILYHLLMVLKFGAVKIQEPNIYILWGEIITLIIIVFLHIIDIKELLYPTDGGGWK